jgi:hypothetical protein
MTAHIRNISAASVIPGETAPSRRAARSPKLFADIGIQTRWSQASAVIAPRMLHRKIRASDALGDRDLAKPQPVRRAPIEFRTDNRQYQGSMPVTVALPSVRVTRAGRVVVWLHSVGHAFARRLAAVSANQSSYHVNELVLAMQDRNGHFSPISWNNG